MHQGLMEINERSAHARLQAQLKALQERSQQEGEYANNGYANKGITAKGLSIQRLTHLLVWAIRYAMQQKEEAAAMRKLALIDELTGLYNRRGFLVLARQQLKHIQRTNRHTLLVFADVDGLKRINDAYGHCEGDRVLKETASVLRKTFRDSDIIARLGGDEFVILAQDAPGNSEQNITARLQKTLRAHNERQRRGRDPLSLSFGFSPFNCYSSSIENHMIHADRDMYYQKRTYQSVCATPSGNGHKPRRAESSERQEL